MSWPVYLIVSLGGGQRDHHAIFVETEDQGPKTGQIYQVFGSMQSGMTFETRAETTPPEDSLNFIFLSKTLLGTIKHEDYPKVLEVCQRVEAPKKQFQGPKRLYPTEPLRACQEWTKEAIEALKDEKILEGCDVVGE
ncbi:hypothetical protein TWF696_006472 [Orbilia brochopaga]|uniref:Uncharacterized protein n=1 Tax=Orbilia brochopaga TaxID=3140254 RepID=A0AAV9UWF2_9PEZI